MPDGPASEPIVTDRSRSPTSLFSGLRVVSLLTLLSRILGLIRDIGMATLFGNGPVMDAFSVAFRIPNLARRLFGEGALAAAFLPVFIREKERGGLESAWRVASAVLAVLAIVLCLCVLAGELLLWGLWALLDVGPEAQLLIGLTAVMLPYLVLVCLVAQVSAVLHGSGRFAAPAFAPAILNLVWIAAIWLLAPRFDTPMGQVYAVATCITLAGMLQLAAMLPVLRQVGFRFDPLWRTAKSQVGGIVSTMVPVVIGLSITQLNTLADSLIAWGFSRSEAGPAFMPIPGVPAYPLEPGTASALYFGQRMYQFPLGLFGVALGTVLFPVLAQHAERGRLRDLREDLALGVRLVTVIGLPASLGLILLAERMTALLFRHGAFDASDARQTSAMIACYGVAVWAYGGLLIIHRGFYAVGDRVTPLRVGLVAVALNLSLSLTLIWVIGGTGLALATSIAAMLQVTIATWLIQQRIGGFDQRNLASTAGRAAVASAIMGIACWVSGLLLPLDESLSSRLLAVFGPLTVAVAVYLSVAKLLGLREVEMLFRRGRSEDGG